MLKNVCLLLLVVALVTCQRGGKAKNKAKNMDREGARERVENVDREAVADKAAGKKNKFKDMFGDGKNLSKKKLLKMTSDHLPTGIHLPTGMCRTIFLFEFENPGLFANNSVQPYRYGLLNSQNNPNSLQG